jgi:arsenite methyltransferase
MKKRTLESALCHARSIVMPWSVMRSDASPSKRFGQTPHAPFSVCQPELPARPLSDEEILNLNTYDFMAYVGKSVINPGGTQGRDKILDIVNPRPGTRVLEIGCGTGHTACHIARRYRCHVTAIDISPAMIDTARQVVHTQKLQEQVDCRVGDIAHLPFADGTFDAVICQAVLMFVNKHEALQEIRRVLRAHSSFAGLEFSWRCDPTPLVRDITHRICGCRILEFYSAAEWGQQLKQAGFDKVEANEQPFTMLSLSGFLHDEGVANSLKIFGRIIRRKANIQRMGEIWQHFSRHIDYFSYTVFTGVTPGVPSCKAAVSFASSWPRDFPMAQVNSNSPGCDRTSVT